ncbi:aminoacyl-histidine dipeptidase [Ignatzschineria ureiclastica]|uniref:Cytosol non-specific dipeptidase n=1 Tax=Ignatzschineria ureiclastica TaxID=472582 RepID=A0A2U2AGL3_9GAMM|nr:aminoacyl-histidine dipeptidase [Ignatzschineria ureiclastica]PWD81780.1 aminoacyl-histidine dipeptidase [Ignatzschineria ureiclastica]GGZ90485.1 aminoacyl-histidine dipeptidase [Ignatzschineria ureiclastica]
MIEQKSPQLLWQHFAQLSAIPRPSKKEERVRAFYKAYAAEKGFAFDEDEIGNIVIKKPATPGYENAPKVILQGHIDMVCQKRDESDHDFDNDPIALQIKEDWLYATDTTLGADNGIGVAAAVAILEDETAEHGPLEVLLTVDEEQGMGGVQNIRENWLEGQYLLNLDSEEEGECTVGCAGGSDFAVTKALNFDQEARGVFYRVSVEGLRGGHSGIDVHKELGNANMLLAELLAGFAHRSALRLASFTGGTLRNAIPRSAVAVVSVHEAHKADFEAYLEEMNQSFKARLKGADDGVNVRFVASEPQPTIDAEESAKVLNLLLLLPCGVIRKSVEIPVVETSCNVGVVRIDSEHQLQIDLLARSITDRGLDVVRTRIKAAALLSGAFSEESNDYPAWQPNLDSVPLQRLLEIYRAETGEEMKISVLHAGLETGLLGQKYPHLEMVSFGPTIKGAHSPDERVNIPSVDRFYHLLKLLLKNLK